MNTPHNFFEGAQIASSSVTLYNQRLHEWISYMPPIYQSLSAIVSYPTHAMKILNESLTTNTPSTKHVFIVAVMSYLRHSANTITHLTDEELQTLRTEWNQLLKDNDKPIIERRLQNTPTDLQLKKGGVHLTFDQIVQIRDALPHGSIEKLLISFYTMIPPVRADYYNTQIVYNDEKPTEPNFICIRAGSITLTLTDFKTSSSFHKIQHILPNLLSKQLLSSLATHQRTRLFLNSKLEPFTRNSYTLWTRRLLTKIFGVDFTLVFFRHAYVSHFLSQPSLTDQQVLDTSRAMGHSTEMFRAYRFKTPPSNIPQVDDDSS
jgi:hypothetical protein